MTELDRLKAKREQLAREQEVVRIAGARVAGAIAVIDQMIAGVEAEVTAKPVKIKRVARKAKVANGTAGDAIPVAEQAAQAH